MQESVADTILEINKEVAGEDRLEAFTRVNVPFPCDCINGEFLGHIFEYEVKPSDTYEKIASLYYSNLTTVEWLQQFNVYEANEMPDNVKLNVTVNCSCGDSSVSKDFGLFITYPLRPGETLDTVLNQTNLSEDVEGLVQSYNKGVNFSQGDDLVYIPGKVGISSMVVAGMSLAAVAGFLLLAAGVLYFGFYRKKKLKGEYFSQHHSKVYLLKLGMKVAIKKMRMQASKEFLAELKVLTHVHHLNLVRLIGYCVEGSLFIVYEYIENGNLSKHLRGSGKDPLPWSTRVQIALDSSRGLEYVHEHTVPVYIHRDIKSANTLIDENFRGKVADFGLAKLFPKVGSAAFLPIRLVGTFGYMAPEYARFGEASPKVDVYAFGVILYELISAKAAIVKTNDSAVGSKGLVALFENVLNQPDPREHLCKLIDPRLGDNYPLDSVHKMAQLAKACTEENPKLRLSMRSILVLQNDIDLLNPPAELEKKKHKLKRLVQSPNSFFMDVKCQGCFNITTVFSHSQTVVVCGNCQTVLCQPTGGRARLTEGCSFRKKGD
ncbi:hypothetical protein CRYUN_Cryun01aG0120900 [Craigia yunnanensis]